MTTTPPVPQANQSPYPIQEAPHAHTPPPAGAAIARTPTRDKQESEGGWRLGSASLIAGAAVGIAGAAAGIALLASRSRGGGKDEGKHKSKNKTKGKH